MDESLRGEESTLRVDSNDSVFHTFACRAYENYQQTGNYDQQWLVNELQYEFRRRDGAMMNDIKQLESKKKDLQ